MPRRRARAVCHTELPIRASPVEEFEGKVKPVLAFLTNIDPGARSRLAMIARTYHDSRRMEAQKAPRPDSRKSLEAISNLARRAAEIVSQLPNEHRQLLGRITQRGLLDDRDFLHANDMGLVMSEVADLDLRRLIPGADPTLQSKLDRCGAVLGKLADRCLNLPMDAEWHLTVIQEGASLLPTGVEANAYLQRLCVSLSKFADAATEVMKCERGPHGNTAQTLAVQALAVEFERSGQALSHNAKVGRLYGGDASSTFGQFVHCFFDRVEPEFSRRRGLADAIAYVCWPSRGKARGKLAARETDERRALVASLLD